MKMSWTNSKKFLAVLLVLTLVLQMGSTFTLNTVSADENVNTQQLDEEITNVSSQQKLVDEQQKSIELDNSKGTEPIETEENLEETNSNKTEPEQNNEGETDNSLIKASQSSESKDLGNIFSSVILKVNGNQISTDTTIEVTEDTTIRIDYNWELEDSVNLQSGDWAEISIPDEFIPFSDTDGDLLSGENIKIGTYYLNKNSKTLRVEFNDELVGKQQRSGNVWFNFEFDLEEFEDDTSQEVKFNDKTDKSFTITLKPKGNNPIIDKSGLADKKMNPTNITWTLDINKGLEELKGVTVEDVLPEGVELENIEIYDLTIGYDGSITGEKPSTDKSATKFPIDFGDINSAYSIRYTTKITDNSKLSFTNEATINSNDGPHTDNATVEITRGNYIEKKDGIANKDLDATEINWVINVNESEDTINNAKIIDQLPDGLTVQEGTIKIYELTFDNAGNEVIGNEIKDKIITNNGDNFEIALGDINEAYQIKYTTDIDYSKVNSGEYQQSNKFINKATLTASNIEQKEDTGEVTIKRDSLLKKNGDADIDYNNKTIEWTIHVNKANANIKNVKITDTIGEGLELIEDSFIITDSSGKEITNPKPQVTTDGFTIDFGNIDSSYKIVYKTEITNYDQVSFENKAKLTGDGIGVGDITEEANEEPEISNNFNKSAKDINYKDKTMSWELKIDPKKGKITDLKIVDTFPNNGLVFLEDSLVFKGFDKELEKGTDYTIIPNGSNYGEGFILEFKNTVLPLEGKEYSISYKTSFDPDDKHLTENTGSDKSIYKNKAEFIGKTEYNGKTVDFKEPRKASHKINDTATNNGKKSGKLNKPERKVDWKLHLNYLSKDYTGSEFVVEDTLSEGQYIIDLDSIVIKEYSVNPDGTIDETGQVLTTDSYTIKGVGEEGKYTGFNLTFHGGIDKPYLVEYTTNIEGISKPNYSNSATVNKDKTYTAEVKYPKSNSFVVKEGEGIEGNTVYTDDEINWKITINESLSEIKPGSVFIDTISSGLVYIQDSLKIYDKSDNSELVKGEDYTLKTNDLANDETELKIEFLNSINSVYEVKYDTVVISETGTVKNNASFSGSEQNIDQNDSVEYTAKQTSGGSGSGVNRGSILVEKKDGESGDLLPGAEFELYYLLNGDEKIVETKATDKNGKLVFEGLSYRTYYLREKAAPDGYEIIDEEAIEIKVDSTNQIKQTIENLKKGSLSIVKKDGYTESPLSGAEFKITSEDGTFEKTLKTDNDGKANISNLPRGKYTLKETKAPEGYVLDETIHEININSETLNIEKTIQNYKNASILIVKDDGYTESPLSGAEFKITSEDGTFEKTLKTDDEGKASVDNLRRGNYTIEETKAPEGYELDDTKHQIELNDENLNYTHKVSNFMKASISIVKKDGYTEAPLSGAEFKVTNETGTVNEILTTDENGEASLDNLRRGKYTIEETKAPEGYIIDETKHEVELNAENLNYEYEVSNFMKASISINKIDGDTEEPLSGVKFKVTNEAGTVDEELVTDENGYASLGDLRRGEYIIEEIETKEGYVLNETKHKIELNSENLNPEMTIKNFKHGSIIINKIDGDTEEPLSGAEFELRDSEGNLVETLVSDENGQAGIGSLPRGKYTIQEIKAPEGYELDETKYEVELTADELDIQKTVENFMRGSINILKVEKDTDKVLSGAKFELRDSEGNLVETLVTDKEGKVSVNDLIRGEYTIQEIESPEGYVLDKTKHKVEITSDNLNLELEIENELEDSKVAGADDSNKDGSLPQTGEKSSLSFYITGLTLILIGFFMARKHKLSL
ncbi:SpaA isopeptide-forming pilin-related protein [Senegalia massiliensis]|uniref:LPXTG cell wall anchor domain-containing protein n=1 Tax=Senegalia massiliensis TaxID=1720316 RepID=A0A845QZE7_9CLOT|nr:SpaA isopeptide-forming pilin-related protein [Senegalia massiliensis]NBI07324.1 LPXTG cell wall anchor domain-containing protein [Senegalia massiliensis]